MKRALLFMFFIVFTLGCNRDCREKHDPEDCACYALYAPVCGCNGETYENDCRAECAGIEEYADGPCK